MQLLYKSAVRRLSVILPLLTVFCTCGCGDTNTDQVSGQPPRISVAQLFRASVEEGFQKHELPAVAAGLWRPGEQPVTVLLGDADVSSGRAVEATDHFRIGSVTKSFVVTVLLQLAQEGKLDLQDPISKYLPNLQNGDATLAQLANMTSGIFNYTEDQDFLLAFISDFSAARSEQELLDAANRHAPYFAPGFDWHYSNTNTVALGLVVEQVTGNTLSQELQTRIFTPLALGSTSYPSTADMPAPFAHGYLQYDTGEPYVEQSDTHPSASAGSGAIVSNLEDLRVWGQALGSGSLLNQNFRTLQFQMVPTDGCPSCPEYDGYGLGVGTLEGWIGHTGDYIGYQALVMYDPRSESVVVILINLKSFVDGTHVPTEIFQDFASAAGAL